MADFRIRIIVDPAGAQRGAQKVDRSLKQVGQTADRTRQLIGRAFGALGAGLGLVSSVRLLADFEQQMSTVRAVSGATEAQFQSLEASAKRLGETTRFSASEAASGMLFLARAGFEVDEVLGSIEGTLQLAQAGALELGRAADIASNVLQGFRLEVTDTGRVVDVLALAANSANTNIEQLGDAMKFVAPVAAGMGVNLEEATAAAAALSNAGLQASMAGTGLRRVLSELESPAKKTTDILRELGVTADQVRISEVGLIAALSALAEAGVTTGQALEIFGDRGGPAFEVLSSSIPDVIRMEDALRKAGGTAARVATIMDDNLNGALLRVRSAFQSIVLTLGAAGGSSALRGGFERLASLLRLVAANADILGTALLALAAVVGGRLLLGGLALLIGQVKILGVALLALATRTIPLLVTAALAAFAALAVTAVASGRNIEDVFDDIRMGLEDLLSPLSEPVEAVNAFEERIGVLARSIEQAGGVASLTSDQTEALVGQMENLRSEISNRLLIQEFLAPGSEAIKNMREQVEILDSALGALQQQLKAGDPGVDLDLAEGGVSRVGVTKTGPSTTPEFKELIRDLEREGELLRLNNEARAVREQLFAAEDALGRALTATETERVRLLAEQNEGLRLERELLDDVTGPLEGYERSLDALNRLLERGAITTVEFAEKQRELRLAVLENVDTLEAGVERGLLRMEAQFTDVASVVEDAMVNAFNKAEDALVDFVTTGKFSFKDFADSILRDLARIAVRETITGPLASAAGSILRSALPGLDHGGNILVGGAGGIDRNVLSLNGQPVARVSRGENVAVSPGGTGGGGVTVNVIDQRTGGRDGDGGLTVSERGNSNGRRNIEVLIRDSVRDQMSDGAFDPVLNRRFGIRPAIRGR